MKRLICGMLSLALCLACVTSFAGDASAAEDSDMEPVIVIMDSSENDEGSQPEAQGEEALPGDEDAEGEADEGAALPEGESADDKPLPEGESADDKPLPEDEAGDDTIPPEDEAGGDTALPEDESAENQALPEDEADGDDAQQEEPVYDGPALPAPGVRWSYPVSLTALTSPYLVLVNGDNLLDKSYKPDKLINVKGVKRATSATVQLQTTAAEALQLMFSDAKQVKSFTYTTLSKGGKEQPNEATYENGMVLYLKSGYRNYGTQATTYANHLANNGNVDDGFVAKPGASEHQTGLCADILNSDYAKRPRMTQDFKWTPEAQWMKENCRYYGFILRYTEENEAETGIMFEPWHFRYVGNEVAGYIMANNMTLESFTAEWKTAYDEFIAKGGNVDEQLAYEFSRKNAPPESRTLDEYGVDGDAEVSLEF